MYSKWTFHYYVIIKPWVCSPFIPSWLLMCHLTRNVIMRSWYGRLVWWETRNWSCLSLSDESTRDIENHLERQLSVLCLLCIVPVLTVTSQHFQYGSYDSRSISIPSPCFSILLHIQFLHAVPPNSISLRAIYSRQHHFQWQTGLRM